MLDPKELLRLRDEAVPECIRLGDADGLRGIEDTIWHTVLTTRILACDKSLRDECVVVAIWVWLLRTAKQPLPSPLSPDDVDDYLAVGLFDEAAVDAISLNVITAGSQQYAEALKLSIGQTIAVQAARKIHTEYKVVRTLTRHTPDHLVQMELILEKVASGCSFERKGDTYLHQVLRAKLDACRKTSLSWLETPLQELPEQLKDHCNKLVRSFIDPTVTQKLSESRVEVATDVDTFILVLSLVQEIVDGIVIHCLVNDDILRLDDPNDNEPSIPQLCVITPDFQDGDFIGVDVGFVHNGNVYTVREPRYRHLHILLQWMEMTIDVLGPTSQAAQSLSALYEVCINPTQILSTNPFSKLL